MAISSLERFEERGMCSCQVGSNGGDKSFDSIVWFAVISSRLTCGYYIMLIYYLLSLVVTRERRMLISESNELTLVIISYYIIFMMY